MNHHTMKIGSMIEIDILSNLYEYHQGKTGKDAHFRIWYCPLGLLSGGRLMLGNILFILGGVQYAYLLKVALIYMEIL